MSDGLETVSDPPASPGAGQAVFDAGPAPDKNFLEPLDRGVSFIRLPSETPDQVGKRLADLWKNRRTLRVHRDASDPASWPPVTSTLCAATRGYARHGTPEGDALLVWYRSHGRDRVRDVELYLARRALAACWPVTTHQARLLIHWAMAHVRAGRCRTPQVATGLRDATAQALRGDAAAWLRAGIVEACWRYGLARGE